MLSFFPRDVLDEIWDLIESVSENFPIFSCIQCIRAVVFVLCGNLKKISPYIHLMLLLYQSSGIVYPIIF